ncbi:MAG: hypothetical protein AB7G28_04000 [Pirellulales bacterium]
MRFFFQRGPKCLLAAFALLTFALVSARATAQQDRDRPGRGWRRDRGGDRPGNRNRDREDRDQPRDETPPPAASSSSSTPAPSASGFGTVSEAEQIRTKASETIKLHDKSGNGILENDELAKLGMSRGADKDGDGKITRDELIAFYSPKTPAAAAPTPAAQSAPTVSTPEKKSDDSTQRKIVNSKRKSYRFKSTKDRSNNWRFSSRDANGDGQVSMSEYASSWTDRTAAEFQRYDKDNDGMITAEEGK